MIGVWILLVSGGLLNYFLYFFFFRNGIVPAWMTGDLFRLFWYVGICVMLCGWWGMQLFAEESHPADGQNHDNKSERRLRLAVNAEVAYHLFAMLCLSMLPVAVRQYAAVRILMSIVNALLDVWVHWTLFSLFGKIAGLVRCLSSARQASFLKILFAILCMAFVVQFCVLTAFSSEFSTRVFLWIYLGLALNIAFWIVRLWAIVIFIIVYRELGAFRSTASTTSEDARPFWVPQVVALLFQRLRKLASYASYHGPSQPT
ncbi:MAG: hypothetical protein FWD61_01820 [Phycisphaerales bacterium]|nr:hypothetical protein [Phycisphaerales bacterium]